MYRRQPNLVEPPRHASGGHAVGIAALFGKILEVPVIALLSLPLGRFLLK
jgi:hypothetical protein